MATTHLALGSASEGGGETKGFATDSPIWQSAFFPLNLYAPNGAPMGRRFLCESCMGTQLVLCVPEY
jgi:hypothetical protein